MQMTLPEAQHNQVQTSLIRFHSFYSAVKYVNKSISHLLIFFYYLCNLSPLNNSHQTNSNITQR